MTDLGVESCAALLDHEGLDADLLVRQVVVDLQRRLGAHRAHGQQPQDALLHLGPRPRGRAARIQPPSSAPRLSVFVVPLVLREAGRQRVVRPSNEGERRRRTEKHWQWQARDEAKGCCRGAWVGAHTIGLNLYLHLKVFHM